MEKNILLGVIMVALLAGAVTAISTDSNIQVRSATDYDATATTANFLNQNPDPAEPGGYVEIRVKVENVGSASQSNMQFEILPEYPFSLDPGKSAIIRIGDVDARQMGEDAWVLFWKLRIDKEAVEGNNRVRIRYSSNNGLSWVTLEDLYVRVQTNDAIIQITEATTEPKIVEPGKEFTLTVGIENLADSPLKDITGTMTLLYAQGATPIELPFTPLGSGNSRTLSTMESGGRKTMTFTMIADTDAATGIYKVPFQITYSDHLAKNYTSNNIIGVRVGTEPDLFVTTDRPSPSQQGTEQEMTLRFVNKGKENIRFLFVTLGDTEGLDILSPKTVYIGNIDSDDFETEGFTVKGDECDVTYMVPVTFEYESMSNEKYSEKTEVGFMSCSSGQQQSGSGTGWIGFLIIVAIVVAAIWIYKRKKRKASNDR